MTVIDPGHKYSLNLLDAKWNTHSDLIFVKRQGQNYPDNKSSHAGTNLQEVIRACIDRVKYLDNQIPCTENKNILLHLRHIIWQLELRAAVRHSRAESITDVDVNNIEFEAVCFICGHIRCNGRCIKNDSTNQTNYNNAV